MESAHPADCPNIIFDLGGVLLNIDPQLTIKALKALGLKIHVTSFSDMMEKPLFVNYETGKISSADFRNGLRQMLNDNYSDEKIDEAWNAMLLDLPKERFEFLKKLGQTKRLALLSNTNELHINAISGILQKSLGISDLSDCLEAQHFSYRLGMRKPDQEIFEYVLDHHGFRAEETLFIDDSAQHVEGAKRAGMKAYHLKVEEGESILDLFSHIS